MMPRFAINTLRVAAWGTRLLLTLALVGAFNQQCLSAQPPPKRPLELPGPSDVPPSKRGIKAAEGPATFRSNHFLLRTDLPAKDARELLKRLESMLDLISKYWGEPPNGVIEMYVVRDLGVWPDKSLAPAGRAKVAEGAGITLVETVHRGAETVAAKAVVYAVADHGTPQHEAVHAYCGQTFGRMGPLWYSEGMAEVGQYWRPGDNSVHCYDYVRAYLTKSPLKPLQKILEDDGRMLQGAAPVAPPRTGDSWQNYAWRWALCHLLAYNPNYQDRFRPLGLGFLTGANVSFLDSYGAMQREIEFEYRFFIEHLTEGFRVDLCHWDWHAKFRDADGPIAIRSRVAANRGWQASGATVHANQQYEYSASGVWQTGGERAECSADGLPNGTGRLEGIIFKDFTLSSPFDLSTYGTFTAPTDGQLFLRCHDAWGELSDNTGLVKVKIKSADRGLPLARPRAGDDVELPMPSDAEPSDARPAPPKPSILD